MYRSGNMGTIHYDDVVIGIDNIDYYKMKISRFNVHLSNNNCSRKVVNDQSLARLSM